VLPLAVGFASFSTVDLTLGEGGQSKAIYPLCTGKPQLCIAWEFFLLQGFSGHGSGRAGW